MSEATPAALAPVEIDGHRYEALVDITFEQDLLVMSLFGDPELARYLKTVPHDDADIAQWTTGLVGVLYRTGAVWTLLSTLLVEQGTEWTPESAKATADVFKRTRNAASRKQLRDAIVALTLGFFVNGALSHGTFPSSGQGQEDSTISARPNPAPDPVLSHLRATGTRSASGKAAAHVGPSTSPSGTTSSAS